MNVKKLLIATVVLGVVWNVLDFLVHGMLLQGLYYSKLPSLFRADVSPGYFVAGDFVAALVFVWVYDRVYGSFASGAKGGATYGFYAGVLVSFPSWILNNLLFVGFPYSLSWIWTVAGILFGVIGGAVAGALYKK